jgi:hypothetical protein
VCCADGKKVPLLVLARVLSVLCVWSVNSYDTKRYCHDPRLPKN